MNRPIVSPVLVGRTAEVAALAGALEELRGGRGQTVLIAGEAGIGKSRLVAEARGWAEQFGLTILEGHCFEPDRALPYAPFIDLLRGHVAGMPFDQLRAELGPAAPEVVKVVPAVAALLPGVAPSAPLGPEPDKRRLVDALGGWLSSLAAARPLLVVVEDVHWADDTSLELLLHLARRAAADRVLLLLTYRTDEPHPGLGHLLAELERSRLTTELRLPRLGLAEVDALLRAIFDLDYPVRADFVAAIHTLTDGNPFFVEEVLTSLVAFGDVFPIAGRWGRKELDELRIPRSVEDAVRRRAAHLSPAARETLRLAAVLGQRFDFTLLQALTGQDEPALLSIIKDLMAAQLVVEVSAEQFAFRHALTRQAIRAELLARERHALHRRVAEAIERLHAGAPDPHLQDLAYHWFEASIWPKVLEYGRRAGERALALCAPRAAIEQFTRALEAAHHLSVPPDGEVHRGRGLAHATVGEFESARADLEAALDLAQAGGDRLTQWRVRLDLGLLWASRDYAMTGEHYRQALALARALGDPAAIAHSLNRLGNWQLNVDEPLEVRRHHEEALAIFRALDDLRGAAETLDLLGVACNMVGDLSQSTAYYQQAVALFRMLDDRQGLASSLAVRAERGSGYFFDTVPALVPATEEAMQDAELALELAREIGWRAGEAYALEVVAGCLGSQGRLGPGLESAIAAVTIAEDIGHAEWVAQGHCYAGALYRDLLALDLARRHLEQALAQARTLRSPFWVRSASGLLASACVEDNDLDRAEAVLAAAMEPDTPPQTLGRRLCWRARAELALARGDAALVLRIVDELIASAPRAAPEAVIPGLWQLRGEALGALGRAAEAEAALQAAAVVAAELGRTPLLWRIHTALGRLWRAQRRRAEAETAFSAAHAVVEDLAGTIEDQVLRARFLEQAHARCPRSHRSTPLQMAKREFGGLTRREREVAVRLAQGRSNRAIAAELVVAERTVEGHVTSILSKLGLETRTQVAAWALATGLAGTPD